VKLRLEKPWIDLTDNNIAALPGQLGVYQLANDAGNVMYIGFAGGKSLFGLRSALAAHVGRAGVARFRCEVNMQYQTRYQELLMLHMAEHGDVPVLNANDRPARLGRLG
jgi:hypothetical protein